MSETPLRTGTIGNNDLKSKLWAKTFWVKDAGLIASASLGVGGTTLVEHGSSGIPHLPMDTNDWIAWILDLEGEASHLDKLRDMHVRVCYAAAAVAADPVLVVTALGNAAAAALADPSSGADGAATFTLTTAVAKQWSVWKPLNVEGVFAGDSIIQLAAKLTTKGATLAADQFQLLAIALRGNFEPCNETAREIV